MFWVPLLTFLTCYSCEGHVLESNLMNANNVEHQFAYDVTNERLARDVNQYEYSPQYNINERSLSNMPTQYSNIGEKKMFLGDRNILGNMLGLSNTLKKVPNLKLGLVSSVNPLIDSDKLVSQSKEDVAQISIDEADLNDVIAPSNETNVNDEPKIGLKKIIHKDEKKHKHIFIPVITKGTKKIIHKHKGEKEYLIVPAATKGIKKIGLKHIVKGKGEKKYLIMPAATKGIKKNVIKNFVKGKGEKEYLIGPAATKGIKKIGIKNIVKGKGEKEYLIVPAATKGIKKNIIKNIVKGKGEKEYLVVPMAKGVKNIGINNIVKGKGEKDLMPLVPCLDCLIGPDGKVILGSNFPAIMPNKFTKGIIVPILTKGIKKNVMENFVDGKSKWNMFYNKKILFPDGNDKFKKPLIVPLVTKGIKKNVVKNFVDGVPMWNMNNNKKLLANVNFKKPLIVPLVTKGVKMNVVKSFVDGVPIWNMNYNKKIIAPDGNYNLKKQLIKALIIKELKKHILKNIAKGKLKFNNKKIVTPDEKEINFGSNYPVIVPNKFKEQIIVPVVTTNNEKGKPKWGVFYNKKNYTPDKNDKIKKQYLEPIVTKVIKKNIVKNIAKSKPKWPVYFNKEVVRPDEDETISPEIMRKASPEKPQRRYLVGPNDPFIETDSLPIKTLKQPVDNYLFRAETDTDSSNNSLSFMNTNIVQYLMNYIWTTFVDDSSERHNAVRPYDTNNYDTSHLDDDDGHKNNSSASKDHDNNQNDENEHVEKEISANEHDKNEYELSKHDDNDSHDNDANKGKHSHKSATNFEEKDVTRTQSPNNDKPSCATELSNMNRSVVLLDLKTAKGNDTTEKATKPVETTESLTERKKDVTVPKEGNSTVISVEEISDAKLKHTRKSLHVHKTKCKTDKEGRDIKRSINKISLHVDLDITVL